jgi:hypothetical protein
MKKLIIFLLLAIPTSGLMFAQVRSSTIPKSGNFGFLNRTGQTISPATATDTLKVATGFFTGDIQATNLIKFDNTDFNTKLGYQAGLNIVAGAQYNTFLGYQAGSSSAGESTNAADYNIGIGYHTLFSNTTGSQNTANGVHALYSNTTGSSNTANGMNALYSNTTGSSNTANGMYALYSNTTGSQNTANGMNALSSNTTGSSNTANGYQVLYSNTEGYNNTANGYQALSFNTTGSYNTASGYQALSSNTTGYSNTANGYRALFSNTTGIQNTASGLNVLYNLGTAQTAGSFNIGTSYTIASIGTTDFTLIGASSNTVGVVFTATGVGSGTGTATPNDTNNNTAFGYNTGGGIIYGTGNTILGANVTGLSTGLTNNIIIADGEGNRRINVDNNGNVSIATTSFPSVGTKTLILGDGDAPSGMNTSTAGLYADTVAGVTELRGIDGAGNMTTLTPHDFSMFEPPVEASLPWSYTSRNEYIGKEIAVDMWKLAKLVEQLTGEKLIYERDLADSLVKSWDTNQEYHYQLSVKQRQQQLDAYNVALADWNKKIKGMKTEDVDSTKKPMLIQSSLYVKVPPPAWLKVRLKIPSKL